MMNDVSSKKDQKYKKEINKLKNWVASKNWDIEFGYIDDQMSIFEKVIYINTRSKLENQLYACLHECGHMLIQLNKNYHKKYPNAHKIDSLPTRHKGLVKSSKYQVDIITEEIDAWRKGKEIAKRLGIRINENSYNNEMSKYIFGYIKAAGHKE